MPRRRPPRRFSPEFRAEAVRLVHDTSESLAKIFRDLGGAARAWVSGSLPPVHAHGIR